MSSAAIRLTKQNFNTTARLKSSMTNAVQFGHNLLSS